MSLLVEVSLLFGDRQVSDVVAVDLCDIYQLTKAKFDDILEEYQEIKEKLTLIAGIRRRHRSSKTEVVPISLTKHLIRLKLV